MERRFTLAEYASLPDCDEYRDELSRGLLVREPLPGWPHTSVTQRLYRLLLKQERLGRGVAVIEGGFLLSRDPPTVRGPDAAFVLARNFPAVPPRGWLELAPDLAVEVLSPSNRRTETEAKVRDYFEAGTPLVWVVDPRRRTVQVRLREGGATLFNAGEFVTGAPVLPALRVRVGELFGG